MSKFTIASVLAAFSAVAPAGPFTFSTGNVTNSMAAASRPGLGGKIEIEAADDFLLTSPTMITSATFTGLLTGATPVIGAVDVEFYRVFPLDSTSPPSGTVLTRATS